MEGTRIEEAVSPGTIDPTAIAQTLDGEITRTETLQSYADGQTRWIEATRIPDKDGDGNVRGFFRMAVDITERKAAEQAALQALSILADAIESISHDFTLYDRENRIAVLNKAAADRYRDLGMADVVKVGARYEDMMRTMVERGLFVIPAGQTKDALVAGFVADHRRADGTAKVRKFRGDIFRKVSKHHTRSGGVIAISIDMTEEILWTRAITEARERLTDAIENIAHGIVLYDADDRVVLFNHSSAERWVSMADVFKVGVIFSDLMRIAVERGVISVPPGMSKDELIEKAIEEHRCADGSWRVRKLGDGRVLRVSARRTSAGGIVAIGIDVTEQTKVEDKLRESQRMEAVGQLTGGIAHDFNNHLTVIIGNLEMAKVVATSSPTVLDHIDKALSGARRSAELTQSLLAFARRQPLSPEVVDIGDCIRSTVRLIDRALGENIGVTINLDVPLWPVFIDEAQLGSSLVNLANNARDAMPFGGKLTVAARNITLTSDDIGDREDLAAGEYVCIEVADTGTGMPEEVRLKVFEPFFTTKEVGKGTGLGLSMVHGFVRQSGGHIDLKSEVGRGTTVQIYLPRATEGSVVQAPPSDDAIQPSPGSKTVLVVEDNAGVRQTVTMQLKSLGYITVEAEDAAVALDILGRTNQVIDLLFTDIVMQGTMDGYALAQEAVRRHPGIKVVLTSGFPDNFVKSSREGVRAFPLLGKPYGMTQLAQLIRSALAAV